MVYSRRYSMRNSSHLIEFVATRTGLREAVQFREDNPEFKGRHITNVLQVWPDKIQVGILYSLGYDPRLDT